MTLRSFRRDLALFLTSVILAASAFAAARTTPLSVSNVRTELAADGREAYIVVLRDAPAVREQTAPAAGGMVSDPAAAREGLLARQEEFVGDMRARIPGFAAGARYQRVLNGVAVLVPKGGLAALRGDPRVRAVYPIRKYTLHLDASNPLMGAPAFWNAVGGDANAGRGVKVADLDTGVDFSNPMFSDPSLSMPHGFPLENDDNHFANSKVIVAKYFQGILDVQDPGLSHDHRTAQDLSGHGSHTASVAAGAKVVLSGAGRRSVTLEGVAPKAYIGDYKVFSPNAFSDNIIAAIEEATADGMNVLNMSFGIANSDGTEPFLFSAAAEDEAIQNAIAAGVVVTVSAGNSGVDASGNPVPDSISSTANIPEVIAVGASTNAHDGIPPADLAQISMISGNTPPPANLTRLIGSQASGGAPIPSSGLPGVFGDWDTGDGSGDGTACAAITGPPRFPGRIVLIQRGTCTFVEKIQNAQATGAIGVVFYNKAEGTDGGEVLDLYDATGAALPSIFLRRSDGLNLKTYIDANAATALPARGTIGPVPPGTPFEVFSTPPHDLASFSSIGPTLDFQIKPDLTAPGTGSYAAVQDDDARGDGRFHDDEIDPSPFYDPSGFAFGQGTSFSAPRVAGSAALVKQKHPAWTPAEIKAALMETASRPADAADPAKIGNLSVVQRGSGDVDLAAASTVGSIVLPASYSYRRLAFNASPAPHALDRVFTLENKTGSSETYSLTAAASASGSDPAIAPSVSPSTLTLGAGASGTFTLSLSIGGGLAAGQHDSEGAILVSDGGRSIPGVLYVPYFARVEFKNGAPPLIESASAKLDASSSTQVNVDITASDADGDIASYLLIFVDSTGQEISTVSDTFNGTLDGMTQVSEEIQVTGVTQTVCPDCVAVLSQFFDSKGHASNTLVARYGPPAGHAVPNSSGSGYHRSLPLVAHIQSQFLFQSDVRLFNPDRAHILNLDAYFVPDGQPGANAVRVSHQLFPRQSLAIDDVVARDFGMPVGIGSLVLVSPDGHRFLASSRAYDTNAAGGTFGTFSGSVSPETAVGAGDGTVNANGLPTGTGYHTNVGATEVSGVSTTIRFEGFSESGESLGSSTMTLPPYSNLQFNSQTDSTRAFRAPAVRVACTVLSGGKVLPYAASVDEGSGDTVLSIASPAPESADDVFVTGAGRIHGALGTFFTSDLSLTNASGGPRTVELTLLPANGLAAPPVPPAPITLAAGQTLAFRDVFASAFGYTGDALAGIRVHPTAPASIVASARTATPNTGGTGVFGFFVNGAKASSALAAGGKMVSIHLERDTRFRTNFGFTEVAGSPVSVRATFFDENGTPLGTRAYGIAANTLVQTTSADLVGDTAVPNGYIEFTIDSGAGRVLPFATVVDNVTGDSIYVPAEAEP